MEKIIRIECSGADVAELSQLIEFQGSLKDLSQENAARLERSIIELGFSFTFHVWRGLEGQLFILDGHQRRRVLDHMRTQGWHVPSLPISYVEASSYEEAKKKVLVGASQYGQPTEQGLYEFMETNNIPLEFIEHTIEFQNIDTDHFKAQYYEDLTIPPEQVEHIKLCERFIVPPFSVLDSRQGYWQDRKRAWISLGIQSELGRGQNCLDMSASMVGITDEREREKDGTQNAEDTRSHSSQ